MLKPSSSWPSGSGNRPRDAHALLARQDLFHMLQTAAPLMLRPRVAWLNIAPKQMRSPSAQAHMSLSPSAQAHMSLSPSAQAHMSLSPMLHLQSLEPVISRIMAAFNPGETDPKIHQAPAPLPPRSH